MSKSKTLKLVLEFSNEKDLGEMYHKVMYLLHSGIAKMDDGVAISMEGR